MENELRGELSKFIDNFFQENKQKLIDQIFQKFPNDLFMTIFDIKMSNDQEIKKIEAENFDIYEKIRQNRIKKSKYNLNDTMMKFIHIYEKLVIDKDLSRKGSEIKNDFLATDQINDEEFRIIWKYLCENNLVVCKSEKGKPSNLKYSSLINKNIKSLYQNLTK
uniref:Uncharacterized protein n=1 Tax=viral metagenome TaxID=1070528 RepID=A0A6C0JRU2_9ZZZZ